MREFLLNSEEQLDREAVSFLCGWTPLGLRIAICLRVLCFQAADPADITVLAGHRLKIVPEFTHGGIGVDAVFKRE